MTDETATPEALEVATPVPEAPGPGFDPRMLESLVCPQTHGVLHYDAERQELVSRSAHLAYPIRDGIPIMLASEARALD
jgi:uncharacterized protein YbaR (Trm112 family)